MTLRCRLGFHHWEPLVEGQHDPKRRCTRCGTVQIWKEAYQNSGWEGSDFEPAHWESLK